MLPEEAIKQFKEICKKKDIHLSDKQAVDEANNLVALYRVLA
jgi:hypothetical protein